MMEKERSDAKNKILKGRYQELLNTSQHSTSIAKGPKAYKNFR
jgi:hypothetical protein